VVSYTPRRLYSQGKSPWYSLDRRLDGPQSRSGRGGEEIGFNIIPHLRLGLPSGLIPSNTVYFSQPCMLHVPSPPPFNDSDNIW
jgi:hypothetical protein